MIPKINRWKRKKEMWPNCSQIYSSFKPIFFLYHYYYNFRHNTFYFFVYVLKLPNIHISTTTKFSQHFPAKHWFTQLFGTNILSSIMNSPLLFSFVMYTNMADMPFVISISGDRIKTIYSSQIVNVTIFVFFWYFIWRHETVSVGVWSQKWWVFF